MWSRHLGPVWSKEKRFNLIKTDRHMQAIINPQRGKNSFEIAREGD